MNIIHSIKDKYFISSSNDIEHRMSNPLNVSKERAELFNLTTYTNGNRRNMETNPISGTNSIILDFDDSATISDFEKEFKNIKYCLYTSKSCTREHNKFRVIIELDHFYTITEYKYLFSILLEKHEICKLADKTCSQLSRFYFLPNKGDYYYFHIENGYSFDSNVDIDSFRRFVSKKENLFLAIQNTNTKKDNDYEYGRDVSEWSRDVSSDRRVLAYLNTPYYKLRGNGDSNANLYRSLAVAICNNDNDTLLKIESKAFSERWKVKEIERMKNNIIKNRKSM